ncbi:MAG: DUF2341 domain-containing protein [Methanobacteriota archaeon]
MKKKLMLLAVACVIVLLSSGINLTRLYGIDYPLSRDPFSFDIICGLMSWNYRQQITINSSLVQAPLTDFPVLIYEASDADLAAHALANGSDIIFVSESVEWSTGLPDDRLSHEIEKYDSATGELVAWVKIPYLSSTTDTVIYMYYNLTGSACIANYENRNDVWSNHYVMVQHLNESANPFEDSTSYNNDANQGGGATQNASGKIDGSLTFDGSSDYARIESTASIPGGDATNTRFTTELWMYNGKSQGGSTAIRFMAKRQSSTVASWACNFQSAAPANKVNFWTYKEPNPPGGTNTCIQNNTITVGAWSHIVCVFDTSYGSKIYVNGKNDGSNTGSIGYTIRISASTPVVLSATYNGATYSDFFTGTLDEVRISDTSRNISWVNTTYRTMAMPSSFLKFGEENNDTFYSSDSDGYISYNENNYNRAHDSSTGTINDTTNYIYIGQKYLALSGNYYIHKGYVFFDTSAIPDNAIITSATLSLYGYQDFSSYKDFDITIQSGQPTYPNDPLETSDFDYTKYSGDGGSLNTTSFITTGYNTIPLNSDGFSWINPTGTTKLCLRSSRDINQQGAPGGSPIDQNEYVVVYAQEKGAGYKPKLIINYTMPQFWLTGYNHRKRIDITGQASAGTNYQVELSIGKTSGGNFNLEGNCLDFPNDIRFTDDDQSTLLDYWIENTSEDPITVWVEVTDDLSTSQSIYIYYGNSGVSTASNGDDTFLFFDDFEGSTLDITKWAIQQGSIDLDGTGDLYLDGTSGTRGLIDAKLNVSIDKAIQTQARWVSTIASDCHFCAFRSFGSWNDRAGDLWGRNAYASQGRYATVASGSATQTTIASISTVTSYHVYKNTWKSGECEVYQDTTLLDTHTTNVPTAQMTAVFYEGSVDGQDVQVDWVFVRKWQTSEPAFAAVGSQEG